MQLVEVKNDIAKILYSPDKNHILPSDFLLIDDVNQKLISQIINIETTENPDNNLAVLRLVLSIDNQDNLSLYNGYIPAKNSAVHYINPNEILDLIKGNGESVFFGELANHLSCYVKPTINFVNDKLYIQSDREEKTKIVIQNLIYELKNKNKKIILVDFDGRYSDLPEALYLKISDNFKLPLNAEGLDNIIEYDLNDCPIDDKAVIQSIILELKEYLQSINDKYIPFTLFKNAVDDVFLSNPISGLMLFRNKLWRYSQNKIFAENKSDFETINNAMQFNTAIVLDISQMDESWYKFALQTIMNLIKIPCYMIMSLDGVELDKKAVIGLYKKENIIPVISTSYKNKYSDILKSISLNQLFCKPSGYYSEDEIYSDFLNKLNASSIILYGESTLYLPLLVELRLFNSKTAEDVIDNEIKRDVDKLLTSSKGIISTDTITDNISVKHEETVGDDIISGEEDEVLDSDLDFLDEMLSSENRTSQEENISEENVLDEVLDEEEDSEENIKEKVEDNHTASPDVNDYVVFSPVKEEKKIEDINADVDDDNETEEISEDEQENEDFWESIETIENEKKSSITTPDLNDLNEVDTLKMDYAEDKRNEFNDNQLTKKTTTEDFVNETVTDKEINIVQEENKELNSELAEKNNEDDIVSLKDMEITEEEQEEQEEQEEIQSIDDIIDKVTSEKNVTPTVDSDDETEINDNSEDNDQTEEDVDFDDQITDDITDNSNIEYSGRKERTDFNKNIDSDNMVEKSIDKLYSNTPKDIVINDMEDENINLKEQKKHSYRVEKNKEAVEKLTRAKFEKRQESNIPELDKKENEYKEERKTIEKPQIKENINTKKTTTLPVYETDTSYQLATEDLPFKVGDRVYHPKHGKGVIVGFTNYSNKILFCQIEFENVGRRILDPRIAGIEKIDE